MSTVPYPQNAGNVDGSRSLIDALMAAQDGAGMSLAIASEVDGLRVSSAEHVGELARMWKDRFVREGLEPGDRIVLACPPGAAFLGALLGAWLSNLSVAVVAPDRAGCRGGLTPGNMHALLESDARLFVASNVDSDSVLSDTRLCAPVLCADVSGRPGRSLGPLRVARTPGVASLRLLVRTSGTMDASGNGRWVGLSDRNILSVLDSHRDAIDRRGARALAMAPWHHAFGLVIDLLGSLVGHASQMLVVPGASSDPQRSARAIREHGINWLCAVPLQMSRLIEPLGLRAARSMAGVVGGAPITRPLAETLNGSGLRVGYGLTEASPGVCLGEPGVIEPFAIGQPIGCEVKLDRIDQLLVRGPNVYDYGWCAARGATRLSPSRWLATGDIVARDAMNAFRYLGRRDHSFKLSNGRMVQVPILEARLRELVAGAVDARVTTTDHNTIDIALVADAPQTLPAHQREVIIAGLGSLGRRVGRVHIVPADAAVWAGKGSLDSAAVQRAACRPEVSHAA